MQRDNVASATARRAALAESVHPLSATLFKKPALKSRFFFRLEFSEAQSCEIQLNHIRCLKVETYNYLFYNFFYRCLFNCRFMTT